MKQIIDFIISHFKWIISLIAGASALSFIIVKKKRSQKQKVGDNSIGIQAGRDVKIRNLKKK